MNPMTRCLIVLIAGASAALAACTHGTDTQAQANVARAQASGAASVSAAQGNLTNTEAGSDQSNAAASFRVASAQAASTHDVAIASCGEKPVADRDECTSSADQAFAAANQKALEAQTTANADKAASDARTSGN